MSLIKITGMDGLLQIKSEEDAIGNGEGQLVISLIMVSVVSKLNSVIGGVIHPYFVSCSISSIN